MNPMNGELTGIAAMTFLIPYQPLNGLRKG